MRAARLITRTYFGAIVAVIGLPSPMAGPLTVTGVALGSELATSHPSDTPGATSIPVSVRIESRNTIADLPPVWSLVPREGRFPDAAEYRRRCAKPFPLVAVYLDSFSDFALMDRAGNQTGFVGTEWKVQIQDHVIEVGERYAYSVGVHIR